MRSRDSPEKSIVKTCTLTLRSMFESFTLSKNFSFTSFQDVGLLSQFICPHTGMILETIKTGNTYCIFTERASKRDSNPSRFDACDI